MKKILWGRVRAVLFKPLVPAWHAWRALFKLQMREQRRLAHEISQIRGMMPLLMKQRNGERWTDEDRAILRDNLLILKNLSPYLVLFILPGGLFALPLLAWWLDRRRNPGARHGQAAPASSAACPEKINR